MQWCASTVPAVYLLLHRGGTGNGGTLGKNAASQMSLPTREGEGAHLLGPSVARPSAPLDTTVPGALALLDVGGIKVEGL